MPSRESIELNQRHSMPIVPALTDDRDPAWRDVLFMLLDGIEAAGALTPALAQLVARLRALDAAALDAQADAILALRFAEIDPAAAPLIAAALQVVWTDLASRIDMRDVPYLDTPGVCPVCGSVPVASIVRVGGAHEGYRYVQCGLCATELHVVRAKCTNCDSTKGIAYHVMGTGDEPEEEKNGEGDKRAAQGGIVRRMRHVSQDRLSGEGLRLRTLRRRSREPHARSPDGRCGFSARGAASVALARTTGRRSMSDVTGDGGELRALMARVPSVERVLASAEFEAVIATYGRTQALAALRATLDAWRADAQAGRASVDALSDAQLALAVDARLAKRARSNVRSVFNLTGTVLHTNLGRALLPDEAVRAVAEVLTRPANLEFDLDTGARGDRDDLINGLICELTGAEAATVVNNNAAAVLLTLSALASRKEVIVSRGELVEIGGAFRIPDIMNRAGAKLREVGTTNRTHLKDYDEAINAKTALLMKVHCSNYAVSGFTKEVTLAELAPLAKARNLPVAVDLGSGTLVDLAQWGLPREATVRRRSRQARISSRSAATSCWAGRKRA